MLLCFLIGAVIGTAFCNHIQGRAIWITAIPLICLFGLMVHDDKVNGKEHLEQKPLGHWYKVYLTGSRSDPKKRQYAPAMHTAFMAGVQGQRCRQSLPCISSTWPNRRFGVSLISPVLVLFLIQKNSTHLRCIPFFWQGYKDSNLGHLVLETNALPTELHPYIKAVLSIILNCSENVNTFCRKFYKILLALRSALSSHKKSSKTFSFYCALWNGFILTVSKSQNPPCRQVSLP